MNRKTATHNTPDIYQVLVDKILAANPGYWTRQIRPGSMGPGPSRNHIPRAYIYAKTGNGVKEIMSATRHTAILKLYYLLARKQIIEGKSLKLDCNLGRILARTLSRFHGNKRIDWHNTKKQPLVLDQETGKMKYAKIIYFTSDTYCRVVWKKQGKIANESLYQFRPSKGNRAGKGFAGEFSTALKENPLLKTKFEQHTRDLNI